MVSCVRPYERFEVGFDVEGRARKFDDETALR